MNSNFQHHLSLVRKLSSKNIRITAQRRLLLGIIQAAETHLDAATLLKLARKHDAGINRATVYRTIELLKRLGLVDELDLMHIDGGRHYYEAHNDVEHVHLACLHCGRIEEFTSPYFEKLKENISRQSGFEISIARLELGGRCEPCRSSVQEQRPGHAVFGEAVTAEDRQSDCRRFHPDVPVGGFQKKGKL